MKSKYIVRGISIYAFGAYCYLLKKDYDKLKEISQLKSSDSGVAKSINEISKI